MTKVNRHQQELWRNRFIFVEVKAVAGMTNDLSRGARQHATAILEHGKAKRKEVDHGNGDAEAKAVEEIALSCSVRTAVAGRGW